MMQPCLSLSNIYKMTSVCLIPQFLYGFLVPGYKMLGKIEEQFPGTLKSLGYPFNISKSAMYAIGSPHTWPTLLAALTWLREQIEVCDRW